MSTFSPSLAAISFLFLILLNLSLASANSSTEIKGGAIRLPSEKINGENRGEFCKGTVKPATCPVKCFRADPVCGEDSVTYWCGCADALCHGVGVSKPGACDIGNGVGLSVPGQALLLIHIVWLMVLGFSILLGLF
ncbi:hypothetical protein EUTSA_v10029452mg [Eutrema salsugineum]|uniref:Kazal-like domain-containing protein n=1 Tax=Eutrema salsugineum TaxID=72664 RepID=V4LDE9_EUTSA|nr:uncharacterized protein LOC18015133 [Eutrema salsugineum]ESQ37808.1 hypothetical protein EUTSA_v10029452mg [Eutrema salsugineum]